MKLHVVVDLQAPEEEVAVFADVIACLEQRLYTFGFDPQAAMRTTLSEHPPLVPVHVGG